LESLLAAVNAGNGSSTENIQGKILEEEKEDDV
jgi:hypothetical protein